MAAFGSAKGRCAAAASSRLFGIANSAVSRCDGPFVFGRAPAFAATLSSTADSSAKKPNSSSLFSDAPDWNSDRRHIVHTAGKYLRSVKYFTGIEKPENNPARKKIVFLGTGWAGMRFLKNINTSKYELIIVSPRNYFVFTPLLPSVCSGVLTARSVMEPIRRYARRGGRNVMGYYQGNAEDVNFDKSTVQVAGTNGKKFDVAYDYLIVGVGSEPATFGIPGVAEHSFYLKEAEDAEAIRQRVLSNFELAALPNTTEEEQKRLLHFVCVGGGPSGVEVAAELADLVKEDIGSTYPTLVGKTTVSLVEMMPKMLAMYGDSIAQFTLKNFQRMKIDSLLKTRVTKVTPKAVHVVNSQGNPEELPCGFVLWASGVAQVPLSKKIMSKIPSQQSNRPPVINVDEHLFIKGAPRKNVFCLGDCSFLSPSKLAEHVDEIYEVATKSSQGAGTSFLKENKPLLYRFPQLSPSKNVVKVKRDNLTKADFLGLLKEIDAGYRPPVPTAQNAGQEGRFLANMMNDFDVEKDQASLPSFVEMFKGSLAYVGHGQSVGKTPWFNMHGGFYSTVFWKSVYWTMQMSVQNRVMLFTDWMRIRLSGRDVNLLRVFPAAVNPPKKHPEAK